MSEYKLVPVEPTEEMLDAATSFLARHDVKFCSRDEVQKLCSTIIEVASRSDLGAAIKACPRRVPVALQIGDEHQVRFYLAEDIRRGDPNNAALENTVVFAADIDAILRESEDT